MKKLNNFFKYIAIFTILAVSVCAFSCSEDEEKEKKEEKLNPPASISAEALSMDGIRISWTSVNGASSYKIFWSSSLNGTYTNTYKWTSTGLSYIDTGLAQNTTRYYKVKSVNGSKESDYSAAASATTLKLNPPASVSAEALSMNSIRINWNSASDATSYKIFWSSSLNGAYTNYWSVSGLSFTNTGLSQNTTRYYKVKSVNGTNESDFSVAASATTQKLNPPASVNAEMLSTNSIRISWNSASDATSYKIFRSSSSNGTYSQVGTSTTLSYDNTGLSQNTTYYYKVKSVNGTEESDYSVATSAKTCATLSTPTGLNATGETNAISLTWRAVTNATSYEIYRSNSSSGTYSYLVISPTNSYIDRGLSSTIYYYKVKAVNSCYSSNLSSYDYARPK